MLFESMWPLTAAARVEKVRHAVPDGALTWEIDVFLDRHLLLAEVELPSEDAEVQLPEWLAPCVEREVTGDPAYVNANLARVPRPTSPA
jgi:CYTH domain-containing protein